MVATLSEIHKRNHRHPWRWQCCENGCYGNAALEECEKLFLNYPSFSSSSSFESQKLPPERQQGCVQQRCFSISFTIFFSLSLRHTHTFPHHSLPPTWPHCKTVKIGFYYFIFAISFYFFSGFHCHKHNGGRVCTDLLVLVLFNISPSYLHKCTHTNLQWTCGMSADDTRHIHSSNLLPVHYIYIQIHRSRQFECSCSKNWCVHWKWVTVSPTCTNFVPKIGKGRGSEPLEWSTKLLAVAPGFPTGQSWLPVCRRGSYITQRWPDWSATSDLSARARATARDDRERKRALKYSSVIGADETTVR